MTVVIGQGADFFQGQPTPERIARLPEWMRKYIYVEGTIYGIPGQYGDQWMQFLDNLTGQGWRVSGAATEWDLQGAIIPVLQVPRGLQFHLWLYKEGATEAQAIAAVDAAARAVSPDLRTALQLYAQHLKKEIIEPVAGDTQNILEQLKPFLIGGAVILGSIVLLQALQTARAFAPERKK